MLHLVVCLKQILDPEIPPADFKLDPASQRAAACGSLVVSIFDENALEVALQLRENAGEARITALSFGPATAMDALRKALSMRADEAILLREEDFPGIDSHGTARVLAAAIRKLPPADLVFCGRETGDWHGGMVGAFLAAELDRPYTGFVASVAREDDHFQLRRQTEDGWEIVNSTMPAVITVTNDDHNLPRIPKVKDNMMAFRKQVPVWTASDLGLDPASACGPNSKLEKARLYIPVVDRKCDMVRGDTAEARARQLVERLAALQVI
jgi:electron transfer flavoprotein beta subunit